MASIYRSTAYILPYSVAYTKHILGEFPTIFIDEVWVDYKYKVWAKVDQ